jgi:hypothetical protein
MRRASLHGRRAGLSGPCTDPSVGSLRRIENRGPPPPACLGLTRSAAQPAGEVDGLAGSAGRSRLHMRVDCHKWFLELPATRRDRSPRPDCFRRTQRCSSTRRRGRLDHFLRIVPCLVRIAGSSCLALRPNTLSRSGFRRQKPRVEAARRAAETPSRGERRPSARAGVRDLCSPPSRAERAGVARRRRLALRNSGSRRSETSPI